MESNIITCTNCGLECNTPSVENSLEICRDCQINLGLITMD